MSRATRGCGCAAAVLLIVVATAGFLSYRYVYPWWKSKPPPASGGELQIHILDVGPIEGDSILIVSPAGKNVLIDAGDVSKAKVVTDALKRYKVQQIDYLIITHPHPDHMGGATQVLKSFKVLNAVDNGQGPGLPPDLIAQKPATSAIKNGPKSLPNKSPKTSTVTKFYDDYKQALTSGDIHYEVAKAGAKYDLGGGAFLTLIGPTEPLFTRDQMKSGGNESNANSIVARVDYGDFSMLLAGDAEEQTEHRLLTKDANLRVTALKIAHHGSKYASSDDFLERVKPQFAFISCGAWNRYGHPAQAVLDRLQKLNVKLYRTDVQGEITLTTRGHDGDVAVKTAKDSTTDLWVGRTAQKDDSSRSGFVAYGDFGPPPKIKPAR
ncbi:MAG: ComEC/Rec2 family competence protein [Pyrinomonadaceae bacterium]